MRPCCAAGIGARSLPGLRILALAVAAPPRRGSGRVLAVAGALAQPVKLTLGPTAEFVTGLLQDPGAGLQGIAQLLALALGVGPQPRASHSRSRDLSQAGEGTPAGEPVGNVKIVSGRSGDRRRAVLRLWHKDRELVTLRG
jgi:hypothetical protein